MAHERHTHLRGAWDVLIELRDEIGEGVVLPEEHEEIQRIVGLVAALELHDGLNDLERMLHKRIMAIGNALAA